MAHLLMSACPSFRFRQTQTKSKKDNKLDLFGFDDTDPHQEENCTNSSDGRSSYKIKYFGFDDMSDSDGADTDDDACKETKKAKKTVIVKETPVVTVEETLSNDVPDPFEMLETREKMSAKENKKDFEKQDSRIRAGEIHLFPMED